MTSSPRDPGDEAETPDATSLDDVTPDPQAEVTSEAPLAAAVRPVLTKPVVSLGGRPAATPSTAVAGKPHVRGSGLVKVERPRPSSESLVPPVARPLRSGLVAAPRLAPANAPRALIRPALRGRDEGPGSVDARSQAPRSLDRPIVHPHSRALLSQSGREDELGAAPLESREAPLLVARDAAMRASTRPSAPMMPEVEAPLDQGGDDGVELAPQEHDAQVAYDHTQRGVTRRQLDQLAAAQPSSVLAAGIEPMAAAVPDARPASVWPAAPAGPARSATAPLFSRSAEIPVASLDRSPSSPRAIQQARVTVPFEAKYEGPVPPPSLQERALVAPARLSERDELRAREIRSRAADDIATVTAASMQPATTRILPKVSVITLVLLFQAVALPTAAGAPWELLARPAEVTLQALAAFVLVGVVHLLPCRERTRGIVGLLLGLLLLPFAFVAWRAVVTAGVFDGQPALVALLTGPLPTPALPSLLALVLVPAGLFALGRQASRLVAWILTGLGIGAAVVALAMMPLAAFFASLSGASFLGDRVAAWATLPLFAVLVLAIATLAVPRLGRHANIVGFVLWGAALVPMLVLALFAAKSDQWMHVLEPIKLVTFLAAVSIFTSAAVATAVDSGGSRDR